MAADVTLDRRSPASTETETATFRDPISESPLARRVLIGIALLFLALVLFMPLIAVFTEALRRGVSTAVAAIQQPDAREAIQLTLLVAAIAVPLNLVFGVAAAWSIAKFEFKGKAFLITLIDLPFSVSPVIAGLVYVLLFNAQSYFGPVLNSYGLQICSRCLASCWRRSSSPSPSLRAN